MRTLAPAISREGAEWILDMHDGPANFERDTWSIGMELRLNLVYSFCFAIETSYYVPALVAIIITMNQASISCPSLAAAEVIHTINRINKSAAWSACPSSNDDN